MGMMEFMADMALERNADGKRILEFCNAMELIVTNTFQEAEEQIGHLCIWWYSECNRLLAVARM